MTHFRVKNKTMIEFINKNLGRKKPEYFYRESELMTTFEKDKNKSKPSAI